jgi:hypothetical protein
MWNLQVNIHGQRRHSNHLAVNKVDLVHIWGIAIEEKGSKQKLCMILMMYNGVQLVYEFPLASLQRTVYLSLHIGQYMWCIINIVFLCNLNHLCQVSLTNNKNSIYGEFFHVLFIVLHNNWLTKDGWWFY